MSNDEQVKLAERIFAKYFSLRYTPRRIKCGEAMKLSKEERDRWRDYIKRACIGYPDCDGDLREEHSVKCPARNRPELSESFTVINLLDTCDALEAEIAALREPMACGDPKACLVQGQQLETRYGLGAKEVVCTACERRKLEVAAALDNCARCFDDLYWGIHYSNEEAAECVRAWAKQNTNQSALDAFIQRRVAEARLSAMTWCTGAMSLNKRDNAVIQVAIEKERRFLANSRS